MPQVRINARHIRDWDSFHDIFARSLGFPDFYGRNMNAWIDCMTYLDDPQSGMTSVHGTATDVVVLILENVASIPREVYDALVECTAFVNWRRIDLGEAAILALAFHKSQ